MQTLAYIKRLADLSIEELIEEVGALGGGDDWDGAFTVWGLREFNCAKELLQKRVAAVERENGALRANTPKSILRRLSEQGAIATE